MLTLFRMGPGEAKSPLSYQFSPETSRNVGISTQIFWTFTFNPFAILVQNFKAIPSVGTKLLNLNQESVRVA